MEYKQEAISSKPLEEGKQNNQTIELEICAHKQL